MASNLNPDDFSRAKHLKDFKNGKYKIYYSEVQI